MQAPAGDRDRRRYHRVGFHTAATLKVAIGTVPVEILDISLAGAMIKAEPGLSFEPDIDATLCVKLSETVRIEMSGRILSHGDGNYALQRGVKEDDDEFHLRRLLELNLGDPGLVERDLRTLLQDNPATG